MANVSQPKATDKPLAPKHQKKGFILPFDVNLWGNLDLSRNARHLHMTLLRLAERKTGEVRIGDHFLSPAEIDRAAGMSHPTRIKAHRELYRAGLADYRRDRDTKYIKERLSGKVRKHEVWEKARFYVSLIPRPDWPSDDWLGEKPKKQSSSSTVQEFDYRPNTPEDSGSSTVKSEQEPVQPSPTVKSVHREGILLSNLNHTSPLGAASPPVIAVPDPNSLPERAGVLQDSPRPKPAQTLAPELQSKLESMIVDTVRDLRYKRKNPDPQHPLHLEEEYEAFRQECNVYGLSLPQIQERWNLVLRAVFQPDPPTDQPEPITISQANGLIAHAKGHDWTMADLRRYLHAVFGVNGPRRLSNAQYSVAIRRTQCGPGAQWGDPHEP